MNKSRVREISAFDLCKLQMNYKGKQKLLQVMNKVRGRRTERAKKNQENCEYFTKATK